MNGPITSGAQGFRRTPILTSVEVNSYPETLDVCKTAQVQYPGYFVSTLNLLQLHVYVISLLNIRGFFNKRQCEDKIMMVG